MTDKYEAQVRRLTAERSTENDNLVQYLLLALAGREYGVRLASLQEVLRYNPAVIAPVPNSVEWLEGIFSLRGTIISVVDLQAFLGLPGPVQNRENPSMGPAITELFGIGAPVARLLILHSGEVVVGVIVDDIRGVLFVDPDRIAPCPEPAHPAYPYLEGVYKDPEKGKETWLLEVDRLLTSPEMLAFEPAQL